MYRGTLFQGTIVRWPLTVTVEREDVAIPMALTAQGLRAIRGGCEAADGPRETWLTGAPPDLDGRGTRTLATTNYHGLGPVRRVSILTAHRAWQLARYARADYGACTPETWTQRMGEPVPEDGRCGG